MYTTGAKTMDLFRDIQSCPKIDGCWGEKNPTFYKPIILPCERQYPEVMIVTEQANIKGRGTVDPNWDPTRMFLEHIGSIKRGETRQGIVKIIDSMFGGSLLEDFDEKKNEFNKFYWTHYIKCPGNFRKRGEFNVEDLDFDACANKWFHEEICNLKPKLIVTFGARASTCVLSEIHYKNKWTDRVWEQFEWIIEGTQVPYVETDNLKFKLVVALHPSGQNRLARAFNEKIHRLILNCLREL